MKIQAILLTVLLSLPAIFIHAGPDVDIVHSNSSGILNQLMFSADPNLQLSEIQRLNQRARKAVAEKDWKKASDLLKEAYQKDPKDAETFLGFAHFHREREEYPSAENALRQGLQTAPDHTKLNFELSRMLILKGELENAIQHAELAAKNEDSLWAHASWLAQLCEYNEDKAGQKDALQIAHEKIAADIEMMGLAIVRYEQTEQVVDTYTDTEIVTRFGGETEEIEVERYIRELREAPQAWKDKLVELQAQESQIAEQLKKLQS